MKKGELSMRWCCGRCCLSGCGWWRAALISLWPAQRQERATLEAGSGGSSPKGPSGGQTRSGASRGGGEGLLVGEHVPDRFGELAGDVDLGDLGAALAAQAALG